MKNFNINSNQKPLTPDDIARGKDFNSLLSAYKAAKPPFYKSLGFKAFSACLVACFIGVALFLTLKDNSPTNATAFIAPPLQGIDVTYATYSIDATKDSVVFYETGSAIRIPANAFLDENGNKVTGQVELQYREFHTVQEAFIAGIPMNYDSAGQKLYFETAGMMQIGATQNGKTLKPNPAATINVNMISYNDADRFNSYYLDTTSRKWKYQETKPAELVALRESDLGGVNPNQASDTLNSSRESIAGIENIGNTPSPVLPAKADVGRPRFRIEVSEEDFPEIAVYKNVKFQPTADANYDPKKAKIEWMSGEIKRLPNSTAYEVVFSNASESYSVKANPVFEENDLKDAQKMYNEYTVANNKKTAKQDKAKKDAQAAKDKEQKETMQLERLEASNAAAAALKQMDEASKAAYAERAERLKRRMEAMAAAEAAQELAITQQMAAIAKAAEAYRAKMEQSDLVYRSFQVYNFGFYNSDCAGNLPSAAVANATVVISRDETASTVYLVEKGVNRMFSYYQGSLATFRYTPSATNLLWCVTSTGKLAILKPDQFASSVRGGKNVTFHMQLIDKKFTNVDDVKSYLEI